MQCICAPVTASCHELCNVNCRRRVADCDCVRRASLVFQLDVGHNVGGACTHAAEKRVYGRRVLVSMRTGSAAGAAAHLLPVH